MGMKLTKEQEKELASLAESAATIACAPNAEDLWVSREVKLYTGNHKADDLANKIVFELCTKLAREFYAGEPEVGEPVISERNWDRICMYVINGSNSYDHIFNVGFVQRCGIPAEHLNQMDETVKNNVTLIIEEDIENTWTSLVNGECVCIFANQVSSIYATVKDNEVSIEAYKNKAYAQAQYNAYMNRIKEVFISHDYCKEADSPKNSKFQVDPYWDSTAQYFYSELCGLIYKDQSLLERLLNEQVDKKEKWSLILERIGHKHYSID